MSNFKKDCVLLGMVIVLLRGLLKHWAQCYLAPNLQDCLAFQTPLMNPLPKSRRLVDEGFIVNLEPDSEGIEQCKKLGEKLARA